MRSLARFLVALSVVSGSPLTAREPTAVEQYYLELINRARANPSGEVNWITSNFPGRGWDGKPGLNEGLAPGTISGAAKQPIAFNPDLLDAALDYADLLLINEAFSHTYSGSPTSRASAAGYSGILGENLAISASSDGLPPLDGALARDHHADLFIDSGVSGRGHRLLLMNDDFREVGIALRLDPDSESYFGPPFIGDAMTVQDFGYRTGGSGSFITGVAFNDAAGGDAGFYDVGEGIPGLRLEILDRPGGAVVGAQAAFATGGYSLDGAAEGLGVGTYYARLRNADGDVSEEVAFAYSPTRNAKVDFANPTFGSSPPDGGGGGGSDDQPYDFNSDGSPDLVWQNPVSGLGWAQLMRNNVAVGGKRFPIAVGAPWEWHTADLNGDGDQDLLFRNPNTGVMWTRFLRNGEAAGGRVLSIAVARPWTLQLGDFNADGRPDLLWRNPITGVLWIQYLDGVLAPAGGGVIPLTITTPWRVTPWDMNADGHADLVLRSSVSGVTWISYLRNGTTRIGGRILPDAIGAPWELRVADENGDSYPDLLWRNPVTGVMWTRLLNGSAAGIGGYLSPVSIARPWRLVGSG